MLTFIRVYNLVIIFHEIWTPSFFQYVSRGRKFGLSVFRHPVITLQCGKSISLVIIRFSLPLSGSVYTNSSSQTTLSATCCPSKILRVTFLTLKKDIWNFTLTALKTKDCFTYSEFLGQMFLFFNLYFKQETLFEEIWHAGVVTIRCCSKTSWYVFVLRH